MIPDLVGKRHIRVKPMHIIAKMHTESERGGCSVVAGLMVLEVH